MYRRELYERLWYKTDPKRRFTWSRRGRQDDGCRSACLVTGVTKRMGKVADGNTISDYDKEEIKRQFPSPRL